MSMQSNPRVQPCHQLHIQSIAAAGAHSCGSNRFVCKLSSLPLVLKSLDVLSKPFEQTTHHIAYTEQLKMMHTQAHASQRMVPQSLLGCYMAAVGHSNTGEVVLSAGKHFVAALLPSVALAGPERRPGQRSLTAAFPEHVTADPASSCAPDDAHPNQHVPALAQLILTAPEQIVAVCMHMAHQAWGFLTGHKPDVAVSVGSICCKGLDCGCLPADACTSQRA